MNNISNKILLSVVALVLQLAASLVSMRVGGRIEMLEFGAATAFLTFGSILLGTISGMVVFLTMFQKDDREIARTQNKAFTAFVLGLFPLLGTIASLLLSAFGPQIFPFSFLRPGLLEFSWWAFNSQLPVFLVRARGWMGPP